MNKKMFYIVSLSLSLLVVLTVFVVSYGTSDPTVFGHSAGEILVNGSSIVDGSIQGEDLAENFNGSKINASTLSGNASNLNASYATSAGSASSASYASSANSAQYCGGGSSACHVTASSNNIGGTCSSNNPRMYGESCYVNIRGVNGLRVYGNIRNSDSSYNVHAGNGGSTVYRCTSAGALPVGALTTNSGSCGASVDTHLRVT